MSIRPLIQCRISEDVLEQIDQTGMTRTEFLRAAVVEKLARKGLTATIKVDPAAVKKAARARKAPAKKKAAAKRSSKSKAAPKRCPHRVGSVCDECAKGKS